MTDLNDVLISQAERLKQKFFKQSFEKIPFIAYCVDISTIRAFRASNGYVKRFKPLSIFRVWAFEYLLDNKNLDIIKTRTDFKKLRKSTLTNLEEFWKSKDGGNPEFYHFNKLIDLFFKFLPLCTIIDKETKEWIFRNTNVPLDKSSLTLLRNFNNQLGISKKPRMGHVKNENDYNIFQTEIKKNM